MGRQVTIKYMRDLRRGFTLLELIMVVVIIGILSSLALPQYTQTKYKAYKAEAWLNCAALARTACSFALETNCIRWTCDFATFCSQIGIDNPNAVEDRAFDWSVNCCGGCDCIRLYASPRKGGPGYYCRIVRTNRCGAGCGKPVLWQ